MTPYRPDPKVREPFDKFPLFKNLVVGLWFIVLGYTTLIGTLRGLIDGNWWGLYLPLHWLATIPIFVVLLWWIKKKRLLV